MENDKDWLPIGEGSPQKLSSARDEISKKWRGRYDFKIELVEASKHSAMSHQLLVRHR